LLPNTTNQLISRTNNNIIIQTTIGEEEEYTQVEKTINFSRNMLKTEMEESQTLDVSESISQNFYRQNRRARKGAQVEQRGNRETQHWSLNLLKEKAELHDQLQIIILQPPKLLQRRSLLGLSRKNHTWSTRIRRTTVGDTDVKAIGRVSRGKTTSSKQNTSLTHRIQHPNQ
jgi:hypothetical protein